MSMLTVTVRTVLWIHWSERVIVKWFRLHYSDATLAVVVDYLYLCCYALRCRWCCCCYYWPDNDETSLGISTIHLEWWSTVPILVWLTIIEAVI